MKSMLAVAMAATLSQNAFAVVDTGHAGPPGAGASYATELIQDSFAVTPTPITDDLLDVTNPLGFGVSNTQTRFLRYNLINGTFNGAVAAADLDLGGCCTAAVAQGGNAGDNFVIFQITATANLGPDATVTFDLGSGGADGIVVTDESAGSVTIDYGLYEFAGDAVSETSPLALDSGTLANFFSGLSFTTMPGQQTAEVETEFKEFVDSPTTLGPVPLGMLTFVPAPTVRDTTGAFVTLAQLITNATILVEGDFGAGFGVATPVTLNSAADCTGASLPGTQPVGSLPFTQYEWNTGTTPVSAWLCYEVSGATPITLQTIANGNPIQASVTVVPAPGTDSSGFLPTPVGEILRNGATLQSQWFTTYPGFKSLFYITNAGPAVATYRVSVFTEAGTTCTLGAGAAGTIPARSLKVINAASVCSFSGLQQRGSAVFSIGASDANVQGATVVQSSGGIITSTDMLRPGTN
jgi:hypothetical protein